MDVMAGLVRVVHMFLRGELDGWLSSFFGDQIWRYAIGIYEIF